jgi:hypothetical protein
MRENKLFSSTVENQKVISSNEKYQKVVIEW